MIIIASYSNVSVTYTADGIQTVFSFPFDYLRKAFVKVEVAGDPLEQGTDFSVSGKTVVFQTAPAVDLKVRIFRETETIPLVSWADASVLKAKDMTIQQVQVLHILEEYKGQYNEDLANMLVIAGVVTDSEELQHIVDQLNLIDSKATATAESEENAAASAMAAENSAEAAATAETALVTFLATKETITAPAIDTTLNVTGAAADAKVTGNELRKRFKIGGALSNNTNLNDITEIGCYFLQVSTTYVNSPIASSVAGLLEVFESVLSGGTKVQRVTTYNTNPAKTFYRRKLGANWNDWKEQKATNVFEGFGVLPTNTDLNDTTEIGCYLLISDNTYINSPLLGRQSGILEVYSYPDTPVVVQKITSYTAPTPVTYIRRKSYEGVWNEWRTGYGYKDKSKENAFELYTDFDYEAGWYNINGTLYATDSQRHTNLIPIRPDTQYYMGYKVAGNSSYGAFFDENGAWVAPLKDEDFIEYSYKTPNGDPTSSLINYVKLYTFTSPANAAFFSFNISENAGNTYRLYLSSKPIFALTGTGNYVIGKDDALYQKWKDKKLCVIGSSNTMIDRLYREGNINQYVVGFQEYLYPYFKEFDSYGYSSASWHKYDIEDGASVRSIYSRIVTDQLDLSGYDVFVLLQSGNHLTLNNIGSVDSPSDLGDATTYVGGMRQVIDYIYSQNPQALVFVSGIRWRTGYTLGYACNEEVKKMANYISCPYIDLWSDLGINQYNIELYSYDGGNHCNQLGNKLIGEAIRKAIIGI